MPDGKEEIDPAFEQIFPDQLPMLETPGVRARVPIDAGADERAILVTEGDATLDGEALTPFMLYVLKPGIAATLRGSSNMHAMLMGGGAFATPRHVWWNFVSSSRDRINVAKDDWKAGRFPTVPGDDREFIPIPEIAKTVSYL